MADRPLPGSARRPTAADTEDDLLRLQADFFQQGQQASTTVTRVRRAPPPTVGASADATSSATSERQATAEQAAAEPEVVTEASPGIIGAIAERRPAAGPDAGALRLPLYPQPATAAFAALDRAALTAATPTGRGGAGRRGRSLFAAAFDRAMGPPSATATQPGTAPSSVARATVAGLVPSHRGVGVTVGVAFSDSVDRNTQVANVRRVQGV